MRGHAGSLTFRRTTSAFSEREKSDHEDGTYGDGVDQSKDIAGPPAFARGPKYRDRRMQPVAAKFHVTLAGRKLTEGSEIMA